MHESYLTCLLKVYTTECIPQIPDSIVQILIRWVDPGSAFQQAPWETLMQAICTAHAAQERRSLALHSQLRTSSKPGTAFPAFLPLNSYKLSAEIHIYNKT